jgi:hypothetical protein
MKDQILKIAKVKSEKEFYKKYPTEEAFMKAHKKEFKKAAMGSKMVNNQLHQLTEWEGAPKFNVGGAAPAFEFNKFGATADNPQGSFKAGAGQVGMAAIQALPAIIGGIEAIGAQKKAQKKAQQATQLSGLSLQAQQTMEKPKRDYVRPEDALVQPGQMGNPYGTGTNYLQAEDGAMIGGNPTEIQNMYNPGDMYDDLGFEPLEETYKQYRHGGEMPKAEFGEYFQDSGQAQIGSGIGSAIGSAFGPAGAMVGGLLGKGIGNLLGGAKAARKLKAEQDKTAMNTQQAAFAQTQQNQFGAYMEHGGWVSHDWQPQVIAKFGDYDVKDLLKPPYDADMLRSGGHLAQVGYTAPSEEALYTGRPNMPNAQNGVQMAMGGDLEIGEGGRLETLSYNPNLPGGEIGMFRGASHDNGGIKTKYGENEVEVEGNEPVVKLKDGGSSENLVVFGNIKINKEIADLMGDPKAKGKKFKTYIADVAKNDAKQLKRIDKGLELIDQYDGNSSYDRLGMNSGMANLIGGNAWQKVNADKIKEAGIVQDSIHQTANELGVKSDKLAEGKLEKETDPSMMGKNGKKMKKAQTGTERPPFKRPPLLGAENFQLPSFLSPAEQELIIPYSIEANEKFKGLDAITLKAIKKGILPGGGMPGSLYAGNTLEDVVLTNTKKKEEPVEWPDLPGPFTKDEPKKGFDWKGLGLAALSNLAPFLRPSNANEPLPPDQLYPEYFALAMNQVDPVQAQKFQPMLDTPMDISFNDQINAIDSQARAAIRAAGSNPAAQAQIMAQALEAKNQVFGNRDRINTTNKIQTLDKNRAILNDAQLKNLAILDQQYVRQTQAKSNTKEQTQAALSSIAAKTAQQRAANRKLAVMENLYNFRFTPSGRAINMNAPAQFNMSGGMGQSRSFKTDAYGNQMYPIYNPKTGKIKGYSVAESSDPSADEIDDVYNKNGGKTSKTKARNSSIVKALKNL